MWPIETIKRMNAQSQPPEPWTYTITVATPNRGYHVERIDELRKEFGIRNLSLSLGIGLGDWGTESNLTVQTTTTHNRNEIGLFIAALLKAFEQEYAYVEVAGGFDHGAWEVSRYAMWQPITGESL